jgi:ADP-ribose pyrophosphatase
LKKWRLVGSEKVYTSDYVTIFNDKLLLGDNSCIDYERVELRDFCSVLPLIEPQKIVMIKIYRYPADCTSWEIPSGFIEHDESAHEAAVRELKEETGYKSEKLTDWGSFSPWTRSIQRAHLFLAEKLVKGRPKRDNTEQIEVKLITVEEAKKMLRAGKVTHAPTIVALQKLLLNEK